MKKYYLLLTALVITTIANATLMYDWNNFFAASATGVGVLEKGTAGVNTWNLATTNVGGSNPTLSQSNLNYQDGNSANYLDNSAGSMIPLSNPSAARSSIFYLTSSGLTAGTYYVSALVNISAAPATAASFINFNQSYNGNSSYARVLIKSVDASGFCLQVGAYNSGTYSSTSSTISYNTTHLIVIKYVYTSSTSQDAYLFVDPVLGGTEGTPTLSGITNSTSVTVKGLVITQLNGLSGQVAGLRMGTTWADVTPAKSVAPPLSAPVIGNADGLTYNGFTAHWTQVSNAVSYIVKTYNNNVLVSSTNVSGSTTESAAISGLMSGLDYTYKVIAIGDNTNYQNSAESSGSAFTTTGRVSSLNADFGNYTWQTTYNSGTVPATGSFPSTYENGIELNKAVPYYVSNNTGPKGEVHGTYIRIDKLIYGGNVVLPTISSVNQLEIHIFPASAPRDFYLKQYINGSWVAVGPGTNGTTGTYTMTSATDAIFIVPITSNNTNAKFRIENGGSGGINLLQVISRTTTPALLTAPTVGAANSITATTCTANWTPVDANGTNYEVKVYKVITSSTVPGLKTETTTLKTTAITTGGQATSSIGITGLQADSTYIFKVKAIGDGDINYSDSYQTVSSTQFTMAHQLATPVIGTPTAWTYGITANWSVVTNASGYVVNVYQGTNLVSSTNVSDPNATTLNINQLQYATDYTFTVTAKGDNATNFDSAESAKSTVITTDLGTGINNSHKEILLISGRNVTSDLSGTYEVFDLQGARIDYKSNTNILVVTAAPGIYLIKFEAQNGERLFRKMIIR